MAMIVCPNCGKEVSDKAKKCINCGEILIPDEKIICQECGTEFEEGLTECPNCGCPVEKQNEETSQKVEVTGVEVTGVELTKKIKKLILIAVAVIIVAGGAVFGAVNYQKQKAAELYSENLIKTTGAMLEGASVAEDCGNLIKSVWSNSIFENYDDTTDKYTRPKGFWVDDFNDALANLFSDYGFNKKISTIKDNQDKVDELMKKLKNPPEEYKDTYNTISDMYKAYTSFVNCVTSPSGSLQTFSSNFSDNDSELVNYYNAMRLYIE